MTAPFPPLPLTLSARDRHAIAAYERACAETHDSPTDEGRASWVCEWRELDDEDRQEAIECARYEASLRGWEP